MQTRRRHVRTVGVIGALALVATSTLSTAASARSTAEVGAWGDPFAEPTINGQVTDEVCLDEPKGDEPEHGGTVKSCKVTATTLAVLGGDDVVYWNGLEDTEEVEMGIAAEYGEISTQDQVRRLDLASRTWTESDPDTGREVGDPPNELVPGLASTETYNDDVLFCAAIAHTSDGQVLSVGGTTYYAEPDVPGTRYGVVELQGSKATRLYDPVTDSWTQAGDMAWGRWYPTLVPLADGKQFVAGGVGKLMKPLYTDRDPQDSGRNVVQTETFDPATLEWTENPDSADKTFPLYPRLHLIPGGGVYYNAAGQVYNPQGLAYDQALWNVASVYDPTSQSWSDVGIPGGASPYAGFRGSTTSIMLPLRPDDSGAYTEASFLTAGGIIGTTPGTYFAVSDSRVDTIDTTDLSLSSETVGALNTPRWYGQSVLLPTGEVFLVNGASADEVVGPGTAIPNLQPELWNPETGEWTEVATPTQARTYHNSAALLPDGTVLVGGHDPISTAYSYNFTIADGTTTPNETRNPTFEVYSPPYLFRGERPTVTNAPATITPGQGSVKLVLDVKGDDVESVMLMRKTAITHLVDGGQRAVELPITTRAGNTVEVTAPADASITPAGPYLLFVNRSTDQGPVPSEAHEVTVAQGPVPTASLPSPAPLPEALLAQFMDQQAGMAAIQGLVADLAAHGENGAAIVQGAATPENAEQLADGGQQAVERTLDPDEAVEVAPELAYHEMAELYAVAGLADHAHGSTLVMDEHGHLHSLAALQASSPADRTPVVALAVGLLVLAADLHRRRVVAHVVTR